MVAPGSAGGPEGGRLAGAGGVVNGGQRVEAAGREAELRGGLSRTQRVLSERVEHMADESRGVTVEELLMLFKDAQCNRPSRTHHPSFRRASLRSPSSKRGGASGKIPVLLTTEVLLFCSPRDMSIAAPGPGASGRYHRDWPRVDSCGAGFQPDGSGGIPAGAPRASANNSVRLHPAGLALNNPPPSRRDSSRPAT